MPAADGSSAHQSDKRDGVGVLVGDTEMRRNDGLFGHELGRAGMELQLRLAARAVDNDDIAHGDAFAESGAEGLRRRLLRGEAFGQEAGGLATTSKILPFRVTEHAPRESVTETIQTGTDALDAHNVGADTVDHRRASTISRFISATAS